MGVSATPGRADRPRSLLAGSPAAQPLAPRPAAPSQRPRQHRHSQRLPTLAHGASTGGEPASTGSQAELDASAANDPPPTPQQLAAAASRPAELAALLLRLSDPADCGASCTEEHVVQAWAAQRHSQRLQPDRRGPDQGPALEALQLLEELTRRQLVAFSPAQLGFVFRSYVLAGGDSKPVLTGLQHAAASWAAEDYTAASFADLAWALASCKQPPSEGCRELLRSALQPAGGGVSGGGVSGGAAGQDEQQEGAEAEEEGGQAGGVQEERQQAAQPAEAPAQAQQQEQQGQQQPGLEAGPQGIEPAEESRPQRGAADPRQQQWRQPVGRDWEAWFEDASPSRVVLLLWAAADLGIRPCRPCLDAAAAAAMRHAGGLAALSTESLVALLWSLATFKARRMQPLIRAACQLLADRMEGGLDGAAGAEPAGKQQPGSTSASEAGPAGQKAGPAGSNGSSAAGWYDPGANGSSGSGWQGAAGASSDGGAASPAEARAFSTSQLSTVVWACGQLQQGDTRLLGLATSALQERVHRMQHGDIARSLWGLGQLGYCPAPLLGLVADRLTQPGQLARFSVRQLAMLTYAFASLDFYPGQACMDAIADACLAARSSFDPRALAHVLWNMSRLGHVDEPFYLAFVPVILLSIQRYGPAELADVARVYSRYGLNPEGQAAAPAGEALAAHGKTAQGEAAAVAQQHDGEGEGSAGGAAADATTTLFDALAAQTVARIKEADIQDILRILTAFHQMGLQPEELLAAVEAWADRRLRNLSPHALSLALWSFARMGNRSPRLLETAAACAEQLLGSFTPQQLAKVAWSLAKLGWPAPRVLRHAGARLAEQGAAFGDKDASNILWALASQGETLPADALDRIAASLQPRLKGFSPQSLSNIGWAYATLSHAPPAPFLRLLSEAAERQLRAFEPLGLSLLVWSLACLGCRPYKLFSGVVFLCQRERPGLLRQFEGQNLSNLVWGFCVAGFRPSAAFLRELAQEAELRVCDLKPQEMFNIAWAFAQIGYHPQRLFEAIGGEAANQAFAFSPQELSGTLWALAKCNHSGRSVEPLAQAVERELCARQSSFADRHLAISWWAFGQLGHVPADDGSLQQLLGSVRSRLPGMSAQTFVTLASGLGDVEVWRRRRALREHSLAAAANGVGGSGQQQAEQQQDAEQQQQAEQREGTAAAAAAAAGGEEAATVAARIPLLLSDAAGPPLVPPALVQALAERGADLAPQLRPFELTLVLRGLAALGSQQAADRLLRAPSREVAALLRAAAEQAKLPSVVELLWAMAAWQCLPPELLAKAGERLRMAKPAYRFTQPALAMLGEARAALPAEARLAMKLRVGLCQAAGGAAANMLSRSHLPAGSHGSGLGDGAGAGGGKREGADEEVEVEEEGSSQEGRQWRHRGPPPKRRGPQGQAQQAQQQGCQDGGPVARAVC